mmetsp:Transcript_70750/g.118518  ORF Transcript_70750/g.118518 Transcript_70750/m.118518 type:complete len:82 (+) Transcript_70750:131-376(+)
MTNELAAPSLTNLEQGASCALMQPQGWQCEAPEAPVTDRGPPKMTMESWHCRLHSQPGGQKVMDMDWWRVTDGSWMVIDGG